APFSLLSYEEVKKHGKDIADVVLRRLMPPWLPEPGVNHFVGERYLSSRQIQTIQKWVQSGMSEGGSTHLALQPPSPESHLGKPDLIVKMPEPYTLPSEGRDIYQNFVVPLPLDAKKFVRAVDFDPDNKAVHHVFM